MPFIFGILRFLRGVYSEEQKCNKSRFSNGIWYEGDKRVWDYPNKRKCGAFYGKGTPFLCLLRNFIFEKDGKGMERKRNIKDGHIVVKNPLYQELPKHEIVMKSGKTLYRFTGSYDGQKSLPSKILRIMEKENLQKEVDKKDGSR